MTSFPLPLPIAFLFYLPFTELLTNRRPSHNAHHKMRHSIVFWHSLFLVFLILFISLITFFRRSHWRQDNPLLSPPSLSSLFDHKKGFVGQFSPGLITTTLKGIPIELTWKVNWTEQIRVNFKVIFTGRPASILIGFSDHGKVAGSDFCLYLANEKRMVDGWVDRRWKLRRDFHQDCELTNSGKNMVEFNRKVATCDPRDYRIEKGTTNILIAVGTNKQINSLNDPTMDHRISFAQLLRSGDGGGDGDNNGRLGGHKAADMFELDIRAQNVTIPARVTTYWCAIVELEEKLKRRKHHVIKYEAIISPGNVQFVHHFEVFHCQQKTRPFAGDCSEDKPPEARSCSKVLAAWAMGANPVEYPPEAGMPIGGSGFVPFLMVEIHYNNEQRKEGIMDSSGLRITYTDKLRRNDAGIMELGLIYSDANSIPPDQSNFPITAFCPADCTNKFPTEGIFIFASQLHAHLTGRKLHSSVFRGGRKVAEINRDNHFSSHWQHIQSLRPYVHVQSGDVITTTCVYETQGLKHWTWGGYGIEDEMCVNYVHYFPAAEVEVCKSAVSNASLHTFFARLGVKNKRLKIHEKYSAVKWTKAKLHSLRELYAVAPLNIACLQHSGELFPGHPTNWSHVPRPEYGAEPSLHQQPQPNAVVDECIPPSATHSSINSDSSPISAGPYHFFMAFIALFLSVLLFTVIAVWVL